VLKDRKSGTQSFTIGHEFANRIGQPSLLGIVGCTGKLNCCRRLLNAAIDCCNRRQHPATTYVRSAGQNDRRKSEECAGSPSPEPQ
jgi:hypothetical protein